MRHTVLACLAIAFAIPVTAQSRANRPIVLVVHGRGQTARDTAGLRRDALHSLRAGARDITGDSLLRDDDVRLVFYADVLGSAQLDDATSAACDAATPRRADAVNVFSLFAMLAGALVDAGANSEASSDRDGLRSLAADLRYLGDERMRCAAERRLGAALAQARDERRPVVLVGHSLGALVSWGHLHARSARNAEGLPAVERLITMGSPLGSPDIRQLIFGEDRAPIALPASVKSWYNIVNPDDPFAIRLSLSDSDRIEGIVDAVTARGAVDPHELRSYLRDDSTVRAVLGAWCAAFTEEKSAGGRKACDAIR